MKYFFFLLLFAIATTDASAQTAKVADTIGTTANGLPVLRSYVAPEVVFRAKKKYGRMLYCIEKTTGVGCDNSYLVGLIKNGRLTREWMCDDAKMVWHTNRLSSFVTVPTKGKV